MENYIIGTLSGGTEGPRILESIEENNGCVEAKWHNPAICGLSDCIYHNIDTSTHTDSYEFCAGVLCKNGSEDVFTEDPWVNDAIYDFYKRWGLPSKQTITEKEYMEYKKQESKYLSSLYADDDILPFD